MSRVGENEQSDVNVKVKNLSVPGLTTGHLIDWLSRLPPSPHIASVAFHVGINDCAEGPVSSLTWGKLISLFQTVFPSATIQASSL